MSGEDEVLEAITALAAQGFTGVQMPFHEAIHGLSVTEDKAPETVAAIVGIVLRVDPGAIRI